MGRASGMGARDNPSERSGIAGSADTLGYLCDIISELKLLADRSGQRTLSAILAAALTEARVQNDHHKQG